MIKKIDLQISNSCNRRCKWCPMLKYSKNDKEITLEIIKKLVNIINLNKNLFDKNIRISYSRYNEPLLKLNLLLDISKELDKLEIQNTRVIHTNGDLLNNNIIDIVMENCSLLTINNYDNIDYNDALIKIIDIFGIDVLNTISHDYINHLILFKYKNKYIEYFYDKSKIMNTRDRGGTLNYDTKLNWKYTTDNKSFCNVIGNMIAIECNGDIYPCCDTSNMIKKHEPMYCGNILLNNFSDIYNNLINKKTIKNICQHCITDLDILNVDRKE